MFWVFLVSLIFLVFFSLLKIWEARGENKIWFFWFLELQDPRVEKIINFVSFKLEILKKKIKFFFFVQLPFLAGFLIRKTLVKIIDKYHDTKDNVRGRIKIKSERINASPFLKEIAKIKSRKHGRSEPTLFE